MLTTTQEKDGTTSVIYYHPQFFPPNTLREYLEGISDWKGGNKDDKDEWVPLRLQRWSSMSGENFSRRWGGKYERWKHIPYDEALLNFQCKLQKDMNVICSKINIKPININSVLINKYTDGKSLINLHQDKLPEFGEDPTIVCCSFGSTRQFNLIRTKPRVIGKGMSINKEEEHLNQIFNLKDGDLLIMAGASQRCYAHSISSTDEDVGVRYSCIFRNHSISRG